MKKIFLSTLVLSIIFIVGYFYFGADSREDIDQSLIQEETGSVQGIEDSIEADTGALSLGNNVEDLTVLPQEETTAINNDDANGIDTNSYDEQILGINNNIVVGQNSEGIQNQAAVSNGPRLINYQSTMNIDTLIAGSEFTILYFFKNDYITDTAFKNNIQQSQNRIPSNARIIQIDIEAHPGLVTLYSVDSPNTYIFVDISGEVLGKMSLGVLSIDDILPYYQRLDKRN